MTLRSVLPVVLPLLAACATGGGASDDGAHRIVVEIQNDLVPRTPVTAHLRGSDRAPRILGTVGGGDTRMFTLREDLLTGVYVLTAEVHQGQEVTSQTFALYPNAHVIWMLRTNLLTVGPPE